MEPRMRLQQDLEQLHLQGEHDQKSHGGDGEHNWDVWNAAQEKAVDMVNSSYRGRLWLNASGKFVRSPGKSGYHGKVIPETMVTARGPDYKAFAHATGAIRVLVSPVESTIHLWEPPNSEQRDAIGQLFRQTVLLQGDRDNGASYTIKYLNDSAEDKFGAGLAKVVRFIRGDESVLPGQHIEEFKLTDSEREKLHHDLWEAFVLPTWDHQPYLEEYETVSREEHRADFEEMISRFERPNSKEKDVE